MKLLRHPEWAGLQKGAKTAGGNAEVGLQDPFEFEKWLVVETDEFDRVDIDAGQLQAIVDRLTRKRRVALLALLSCGALALPATAQQVTFMTGPQGGSWIPLGGHDFTVTQQTGGTVMIVGRNSEDVPVRPLGGDHSCL